ncbi:hypothetical protein [Legionella brunensis]|uniref:V-type ATP synthase subunit A n=1 Tax=Legionella brunensis TaxID=29422 RepID=A0A0W0SM79_9GAMM|nr:hypothetical protein [Legionella brunensis]KTC84456.1 V-type ATP synthase subunit A [Legionella brunensis]
MTTNYYMVISSLPRIFPDYKVESPPISRLQLEKRLGLLPIETQTRLYAIESLVWSSWFNPSQSVEKTRKDYQQLMQINSRVICNLIVWYFDLRSIVSALRMKHIGKAPPANPKNHWITHWDQKLIEHWSEPDLGLKFVYPSLIKMAEDLARNDTPAVEEFLLNFIWKYLSSIETGHYFDLEALIIYLLRWDIVQYWSTFSTTNILEKVNELYQALVSPNQFSEAMGFNEGSLL